MIRRSLRLAAGTLALALPLAVVAGCGAEKKRTIEQEFASARTNLESAKAVAFTLKLNDSKGNAEKAATGEQMPVGFAKALFGGSITYIADPVGDATLKSVQAEVTNPTDLKAALSKVNVAFIVKDAAAEIVELRLVAGDLYAHLNLAEIGVLAKAAGVEDLDATLDENLGAMDPRFATALADVRAGKWLKLPLATYLDKLQELAGATTGITPDVANNYDFSALATKLYDGVKPYVKVTEANDSSADRVLEVKVAAQPAIKAVLAILKADKGLPFAGLLTGATPADIDKEIKAGDVRGTITLKDGHLTGFALDLESVRLLSTDPGTDTFEGSSLVVQIDDTVAELTAPTELSTVDLGAIIEEFLAGLSGEMSGTASSSATLAPPTAG